MEEKDDKKMARRRAKELRKEYLEEYEFKEMDPKDGMRLCCAEAFDSFNPQTHEAWLMQCPKGFDAQKLLGKRIKLPGRRYIGDLQVRASNYNPPLNECVGYVNSKGKYELRKLPLTGLVVVGKRLNTNKPVEQENDPGSQFPVAPPPPKFKLPIRHPFFGRDYKKRIELPPNIAAALKKADEKSLETSAKFRRTANFYTIKNKMMHTTQTLEEKELEVRQSVVTGIRPKFMSSTAAPSMMSVSDDSIEEIKQEPDETNVVQMNGHNFVKIKEEPTTPKKQKKRKSKGEVPLNSTSNLQDSLITIKEEPEAELQPEKKKKHKKNKSNEEILVNGTSNLEDSLVTIKEEPEAELQPEKKNKQKKNKSNEEILVNGTSNLEDSLVTIKEEPEAESQPEKKKKQKKKKSNEEIPVNEKSVLSIKEEPEAESPPEKKKKNKSNEDISVNSSSNLQDSVVTIKEESESESQPEKKKKKKKNKSNEEISVNSSSNLQDSVVTIKEESESESQPEKKKKKKNKSNEEISVNSSSNLQDSVITIEEESEADLQPEKKKKHKMNKSTEQIPVNGTSNLQDSVVTNEEEPISESPPEKRKKRKRTRGESVSIDENVVVKQEEKDAVAEAVPKKKKLKAAE